MEFSNGVGLATLVSGPGSMVQDDPAMNQCRFHVRLASVCLCYFVRSALTTCSIVRSRAKKHFRLALGNLRNRKALLWSVVAVAGPDVQLAVQVSLAFLSSVGGMALAYTSRIGSHRQMGIGDATMSPAASQILPW